jgi:Xaa-Pro aminopeptidase
MSKVAYDSSERAIYLLDAQTKAIQFFNEIEQSLIRSGISEKTLSDEIHQLGNTRFGIRTHWHKRVVRSGPNTLRPFEDNPPDRVIQQDDILVIDLGPVFESWEADFGRTYVLGNDPDKLKIRDALEPIWKSVRAQFLANPDMTGEQLYRIAVGTAEKNGWTFGAHLAGHLIGSFPHERIPRDKTSLYITEGNSVSISSLGKDEQKRHWILEIHLRDEQNQLAGFYEQLLTAG